jgi:hypothetical protein
VSVDSRVAQPTSAYAALLTKADQITSLAISAAQTIRGPHTNEQRRQALVRLRVYVNSAARLLKRHAAEQEADRG